MAGSYGATPPAPRRPGRPTEKPLTTTIKARCTEEQHAKFIALGGGEWLRKQIDAASVHVEKQATERNP